MLLGAIIGRPGKNEMQRDTDAVGAKQTHRELLRLCQHGVCTHTHAQRNQDFSIFSLRFVRVCGPCLSSPGVEQQLVPLVESSSEEIRQLISDMFLSRNPSMGPELSCSEAGALLCSSSSPFQPACDKSLSSELLLRRTALTSCSIFL